MLWRRKFENRLTNQAPVDNVLCPGGQTAVPAMVQVSPGKYTVYAVSWDGRLHQINLGDGENVAPPEKFIPGNGKPYALNYKDGVIYTATAQGCGGLTNAFHSFDLASRRASTFIPAGGGLWGRRGAAIDAEGRVYLGTGDAIFDPENRRLGNGIVGVKIDANKQLQLVDFFAAPNANWLWRRDLDVNTTPVVIDYRGRKFLVGTSKECRLWLLDRDGLGGEDHRTTLHTTPLICADSQAFDNVGVWGALGAWQDPQGTQWVLVPFWGPVSTKFKAPIEHSRPKGGGVAALKLEEVAGKWQLTPAWLSRDMDLAEETVDRQRHRLRVLERRRRHAGRAGRRVERARRTEIRRRPFERRGAADSRTLARRCSTPWTARPARNSGTAATRLRRGTTSAASPSRTGASTSAPGTGCSTPLASGRPRMEMRAHRIASLLAAVLIAGGVTFAQVGRGWSDWPTPYADAQRTSWLRTDPKISVESMSKPGFELQWTSKLDNQRRGLQGSRRE